MGYKLAGFDVIGCNEIDPKMMAAYRANHNPRFSYLEPIQAFKERDDLLAAVNKDGDVTVEGHHMGHMDGFRYLPDEAVIDDDRTAAKKVANAAVRALKGEAAARLGRLALKLVKLR